MDQLLSPKQIAEAIGASESSVKRWCDRGLLATVKTAGGHRRISVQEALRFVREQRQAVVEPLILSMPATDDRRSRRIEGCAQRLTDALLADNELTCQAIVLELFLAGYSVSQIFDQVVAVAFHAIGEKWECHQADIYQERCSCQIMVRILHHLRDRQVPPASRPKACGATVPGDQYTLPVTMAEIVLRSVGWDARLLGCSIPFDSMIRSIKHLQPSLFWISVSHISDLEDFVVGVNRVFEAASASRTAVVVGGRALNAEIRARLKYTAYCDTMQHLEAFAKNVLAMTGNAVVEHGSEKRKG
ncbi:MAG: cobalamin-dependent protein [Pirellulaceae bacterium]|nr:cobalamin-dependent protein [Pirellulaceae bacterium]